MAKMGGYRSWVGCRAMWRWGFALALGSLAAWGGTDVVVLRNGDRLTGRLTTITGGNVTFTSELAGRITIRFADVQWIETEAPVTLVIGERRFEARLVPVDGAMGFQVGEGPALVLAPSDLSAVNPPLPRPVPWQGSVSANLNIAQSTRNSQVLGFAAEASHRTPLERKRAAFQYLFGKQTPAGGGAFETTQDNWRLTLGYERSLRNRTFGFANGRLEADKVARLNRRSIVGGGGGYYVIQDTSREFSVEVGFNWLDEAYVSGTNRSELVGQLGTKYRHELWPNVELRHTLDYYPSLSTPSDYFLTSQVSLRSPVANNLFADLRVIYDYDATAPSGTRKDSFRYLFGLGFKF